MNNKLFEELKEAAINIWNGYDDTCGYATKKIDYLNNLNNVGDNYGTIIGMFDVRNQRKLYDTVGDDGKIFINSWVGGLERVELLAEELGL